MIGGKAAVSANYVYCFENSSFCSSSSKKSPQYNAEYLILNGSLQTSSVSSSLFASFYIDFYTSKVASRLTISYSNAQDYALYVATSLIYVL